MVIGSRTKTARVLTHRMLTLSLGIFLCLVSLVALLNRSAYASGDASFTLSPSSGSYQTGSTITVSVSETSTSGDNVNAVQANISYPTSLLQYDSISLTGPFTLCGQQSASGGIVGIGCASTSTVSGAQNVASVTFTVEAAGTATLTMSSGSDIDNTSGTSVWNGTLPSASYTLSTPSTGSGGNSGGGTSGSSGSSSGSSGSSKSGSSGSTTKATSTPASSSTPTTTTTGGGSTNGGSTTPTKSTLTTTGSDTTTPQPTTASGSVTVSVTNADGAPVANAKVVLDGRFTEYTNTQGKAGFSAIATGGHTLQVTAPGKTTTQETITLSGDQNKLVALKLQTSSSLVTTIVFSIVALVVLGMAGFGIYRYIILPKREGVGVPVSSMAPVVGGADMPMTVDSTLTPTTPAQMPQTIRPDHPSNQDQNQPPQQG